MEWGKSNTTRSLLPVLFHPDSSNQSNTYAPSSPPLFSFWVTSTAIFVLNNIVGLPLMVVGIICNILNLVVFTRQGFKDTINISLTSLSVCDLAFHGHTLWQTVAMLPAVNTDHWPFDFWEIAIITGSIPRVFFSRVSSCITVFIAVERCVSVIKPLQVKFIFTRKRIIISEFGIYVVNGFPFILSYLTIHVGWKFDPSTNRTYLGVSLFQGNPFLNNFGVSIGIALLFSTFITVAVCTVILVVSLSQQSRWRLKMGQPTDQANVRKMRKRKAPEKLTGESYGEQSSTELSGQKAAGSMSDRDKRAAVTVTVLAAMFIFCYLPTVLFQLTILLVPEFSRRGRYRNAYNVFGLIGLRAGGICATANILVYFRTSTKYRDTMRSLFDCCTKSE